MWNLCKFVAFCSIILLNTANFARYCPMQVLSLSQSYQNTARLEKLKCVVCCLTALQQLKRSLAPGCCSKITTNWPSNCVYNFTNNLKAATYGEIAVSKFEWLVITISQFVNVLDCDKTVFIKRFLCFVMCSVSDCKREVVKQVNSKELKQHFFLDINN